MIPDVAALGALTVLAEETLTIDRPGATTYTLGRAADGADTQATIAATVQPATGRDLLRLPEGQRSEETVLVLSLGELRLRDRFTRGGSTYEIKHVKPWGGSFYDALAQRLTEGV